MLGQDGIGFADPSTDGEVDMADHQAFEEQQSIKTSATQEQLITAILQLNDSLADLRRLNNKLYQDLNLQRSRAESLDEKIHRLEEKERRRTEKRNTRSQVLAELKRRGVVDENFTWDGQAEE